MKLNLLIEKITSNWFEKIFCLILAILLYWTYQGIIIETRHFSVPVTVIADRNLVPATTVSKSIRITVKASPEVIDSLSESDFHAYLDVDQYEQLGKYNVPVLLELSKRAQAIEPLQVEQRPRSITMILEERITRKIPVTPLFTGSTSEGFEVTGFVCQPQEITISGPKSVIDSWADELTITIPLSEKDASFNQTASVESLVKNSLVSIIEPSQVFMSVNILPCQVTRSFTNVPVYFASLNPYFSLAQKTPLTLVISGAQNTLKQYTMSQYVVHADCSAIDTLGIFSVPFTVHLPEGFSLVSTSADTITVSVDTAPVVLP